MKDIKIPKSRHRHLLRYLGLLDYTVVEILLYPDEGLATVIKTNANGEIVLDAEGNPERDFIKISFVDIPDPMFMSRGNNGPLSSR